MKVLLATQQQYSALNGYTNGVSALEFSQDKFNNWIVGKEVLNDPNFEEIQNELSQLKEINYEPTPEPTPPIK